MPYTQFFFVISGVPFNKVFHYFAISTCLGLVATNVGLFCMRHLCGRRTFLMLGAVFNGLFMLGLAVSSTVAKGETKITLIVTFVTLSLVWYSFATGVASRPVATEMVSTRLRAWSFGLTQAVGQLVIWLVVFCTPYFINPSDLNWVSGPCWFEYQVTNSLARVANTGISGPGRAPLPWYGIISSFRN